ncbi:MAG: pyridoxal phosphate-dependent aminotransferase [Myxococcota bacterium]|nr:pyridoxal phosphate-dependent aminotransferase [Myxococcota bacterium]
MFSSRSSFDLGPNRLAAALAEARGSGRVILDLTESNPTRASIPYDRGAILGALALPDSLRYDPSPFGLPAARAAVARDFGANGTPIDATRIVLTASTSEAYSFLFKLLADPGDEVLAPAPSYPLLDHLARLEAVRLVPYRLAYDGAWHVDFDSVRAALSTRTRAIVVVHPNNPTGSYLKQGELEAIASLGVPLISDEVFARYPLQEGSSPPISVLRGRGAPLVFALGGLSKLAALPQMKLAWIAVGGEADRVEAALARLEIITDAFLSVGTPVQNALPALLASRGAATKAVIERTRGNLAHLREAIAPSSVSVLGVEGGWYATLRLPNTRTDEEWTLTLLEKDSVHVHPGHLFDFEQDAYLVVSLLTPDAVFHEGIRRLLARVGA